MSFTDEQIARIAHEAGRTLQQILDDPNNAVAPPWEQFDEEQRQAVIKGVQIARYGAPPRVLHDAWVREKLAAGWTYGETKDAEVKTHPLLVDFDSMPPAEQAKDYLFSGVCVAMNAAADVRQRAENDALALQEAEKLVAGGGGNMALQPGAAPFGGLPPVLIQAPVEATAQPPRTREE